MYERLILKLLGLVNFRGIKFLKENVSANLVSNKINEPVWLCSRSIWAILSKTKMAISCFRPHPSWGFCFRAILDLFLNFSAVSTKLVMIVKHFCTRHSFLCINIAELISDPKMLAVLLLVVPKQQSSAFDIIRTSTYLLF